MLWLSLQCMGGLYIYIYIAENLQPPLHTFPEGRGVCLGIRDKGQSMSIKEKNLSCFNGTNFLLNLGQKC